MDLAELLSTVSLASIMMGGIGGGDGPRIAGESVSLRDVRGSDGTTAVP